MRKFISAASIGWVVSSCNKFSDDVIDTAKKESDAHPDKPIILIDGSEFAKRILQVGIAGIDEAIK